MNSIRRPSYGLTLAILGISSVLLSACGSSDVGMATPTLGSGGTGTVVASQATAGATTAGGATAEGATAEGATAEGGPYSWELPRDGRVAGVLLRSGQPDGWTDGQWWNDHVALLPLDAATGETLPGYEPLKLRRPGDFAASPDGRLLAFDEGSQYAEDQRLQVIDGRLLAMSEEEEGPSPMLDQVSWEVDGELRELRGVSIVTWSADGRRLLVPRGHWGGREAELWEIEPGTGSARTIATIEMAGSYSWRSAILSPDRSTLYLPRYRGSGCCGINVEGDPYIMVLDLVSGEVRGEVPLPGLAMGQQFETLFEGQEDYNVLRYPGLAISPDGARIYIVHAEEERITVVDTERMVAAAPVEIGRRRSALAEFGGWLLDRFAGRAEAKGGIYRRKVAEVSADGRWLYISGQQDVACEGQPSFGCANEPVGLQVVDLGSMELVHEESEVSWFEVSPNGGRILGWGSMYDTRGDPPGDDEIEGVTTGFGLKIVDAATFELVAHVVPGEIVRQVEFSSDGRYAYIFTDGPGQREGLRGLCSEDCRLLSVVELESGEVVATRMFDTTRVGLVGLAR